MNWRRLRRFPAVLARGLWRNLTGTQALALWFAGSIGAAIQRGEWLYAALIAPAALLMLAIDERKEPRA